MIWKANHPRTRKIPTFIPCRIERIWTTNIGHKDWPWCHGDKAWHPLMLIDFQLNFVTFTLLPPETLTASNGLTSWTSLLVEQSSSRGFELLQEGPALTKNAGCQGCHIDRSIPWFKITREWWNMWTYNKQHSFVKLLYFHKKKLLFVFGWFPEDRC